MLWKNFNRINVTLRIHQTKTRSLIAARISKIITPLYFNHNIPINHFLHFTDYGSYVVKVENLPCNVNSTHCEANVYLERVLMVGQVFKFRFTVRDTKGDTTTASVSIEVTDAPVDITTIFPHLPGIIILPEVNGLKTFLHHISVLQTCRKL